MKKINLWYWIITIPFAAFMILSAIPDAILDPKATEFMHTLGYEDYFIRFIGIAKLLGVATILLPLPTKLKEWAYMGLAFDLIGAFVSIIAVHGFDPGSLMIIITLGFLGASYYLMLRRASALQA